jgi:hypothetical protein
MRPAGIWGKIVMRLLRNPAFRAAAKDLRETDGHLRRDAAPAVDQLRKRGARNAQRQRVMLEPSIGARC